MSPETDRPHDDDAQAYEVTFTNAINGRSFTRRYGSRKEAEHAARTEWPYNNTRTDVRPTAVQEPDHDDAAADKADWLHDWKSDQ